MRYELLLQTAVPGAPYPASAVDEALRAHGVEARPDGVRVWKLKAGDVEVAPLMEAGQQVACELRIPLSDRDDLVREVLVEARALANESGTALHDPQLMKHVGAGDEPRIVEQYAATARYAGEMMGVPEAVAASFDVPDRGLKPGTKILLALVGLGVLAWMAFEALVVG